MNGPETADGTLIIIVCRAKHLPNRRKLDKQLPYVLLRIGTEAKRTAAAFRAGQTPEWTEEIRFQLTRERRPNLKLDVLDETKNEPTPIGDIEIDCASVFQDPAHFNDGKYILDGWYDLTCNAREAGKIYLEMTFYPSAPLLPPKVPSPEFAASELSRHNDDFARSDPMQKRTVDEVFELKVLDFRKSDPGSLPKKSPDDEVFVTGSPKKESKFKKLRDKFHSKEPLLHLFSHEKKPSRDESVVVPPLETFEELESALDNKGPYERLSGYEPATTPPLPSLPPPPPPHSHSSRSSPLPPPPSHSLSTSPVPPLHSAKTSPRRLGRKPPPLGPSLSQSFEKLSLSTTLVPFSAETVGLDDEELPTQVYHMGKEVRPLTHEHKREYGEHRINPNEIDPKFYAPTPSEHLAKTFRLQSGNVTAKDVEIEYDTEKSGYLGEGQWRADKRFSPNVFQRLNDENEGEANKPPVPPKVPRGLTNMEYYVLERDNYLKDINGRRM